MGMGKFWCLNSLRYAFIQSCIRSSKFQEKKTAYNIQRQDKLFASRWDFSADTFLGLGLQERVTLPVRCDLVRYLMSAGLKLVSDLQKNWVTQILEHRWNVVYIYLTRILLRLEVLLGLEKVSVVDTYFVAWTLASSKTSCCKRSLDTTTLFWPQLGEDQCHCPEPPSWAHPWGCLSFKNVTTPPPTLRSPMVTGQHGSVLSMQSFPNLIRIFQSCIPWLSVVCCEELIGSCTQKKWSEEVGGLDRRWLNNSSENCHSKYKTCPTIQSELLINNSRDQYLWKTAWTVFALPNFKISFSRRRGRNKRKIRIACPWDRLDVLFIRLFHVHLWLKSILEMFSW